MMTKAFEKYGIYAICVLVGAIGSQLVDPIMIIVSALLALLFFALLENSVQRSQNAEYHPRVFTPIYAPSPEKIKRREDVLPDFYSFVDANYAELEEECSDSYNECFYTLTVYAKPTNYRQNPLFEYDFISNDETQILMMLASAGWIEFTRTNIGTRIFKLNRG